MKSLDAVKMQNSAFPYPRVFLSRIWDHMMLWLGSVSACS